MVEKREKDILMLSFVAGLIFAVIELVFSIYSHSQSALTDAVYDASELVFVALFLFLTPLFHQPVTEKHPYGYFQLESVFVLIKSAMMLSVSLGVLVEVIESAVSGGHSVDLRMIALFQLLLGIMSLVVYMIMKKLNQELASPMIQTEIIGWKLDILYSLGMSFAFFVSMVLEKTALAFIAPHFDQMIAIVIMIFMLPESVKVLWRAMKDIVLLSPEAEVLDDIKTLCQPILDDFNFIPVFYDISKTGRHLWVAIYFEIKDDFMELAQLNEALDGLNHLIKKKYQECTCELILVPNNANVQAVNSDTF